MELWTSGDFLTSNGQPTRYSAQLIVIFSWHDGFIGIQQIVIIVRIEIKQVIIREIHLGIVRWDGNLRAWRIRRLSFLLRLITSVNDNIAGLILTWRLTKTRMIAASAELKVDRDLLERRTLTQAIGQETLYSQPRSAWDLAEQHNRRRIDVGLCGVVQLGDPIVCGWVADGSWSLPSPAC